MFIFVHQQVPTHETYNHTQSMKHLAVLHVFVTTYLHIGSLTNNNLYMLEVVPC